MIAYKLTNPSLQCLGYQFELGVVHEHGGAFKICKSGFHACPKPFDCFKYDYRYDYELTRMFEVEILGEVQTEGNKICTDKIRFVREIDLKTIMENPTLQNAAAWAAWAALRVADAAEAWEAARLAWEAATEAAEEATEAAAAATEAAEEAEARAFNNQILLLYPPQQHD